MNRIRATSDRLLIALGCVAVLVVLTGCPLRPQAHPVPMVQSSAAAPSTGPSSPESVRSDRVTVYLVRTDRLIATRRVAGPDPDRLTATLQALLRETDEAERGRGLRSAVPSDTGQPPWRADSGAILLDLPETFDGLTAREQVLAIGQLVYTLTENSGDTRVGFLRRNQPVAVPDGAGRLLSRPVTRQDYRQIAPG
jgi:spore germination protein GerM